MNDTFLRQLGRSAARFVVAAALVVLGVTAGYRAYRLYYVIPVLWVNRTGIPLARIAPSLESAFEVARQDIPDVSASMLAGISGRRKEIGIFSLLSLCLLAGAGYLLLKRSPQSNANVDASAAASPVVSDASDRNRQ